MISAPSAKAKGTVNPTYPRYSIGGWITISGYCRRGFSPLPSARIGPSSKPKGLAAKFDQRKKEDLHSGKNDRGVGEKAGIRLVAQAQDKTVSGQQQRPEQNRAFLPGPQRRELIRSGKIAVAVVEDVGDGEIVAEGGDHQRDRGEQNCSENGHSCAAGGFSETLPAGSSWNKRAKRPRQRNKC